MLEGIWWPREIQCCLLWRSRNIRDWDTLKRSKRWGSEVKCLVMHFAKWECSYYTYSTGKQTDKRIWCSRESRTWIQFLVLGQASLFRVKMIIPTVTRWDEIWMGQVWSAWHPGSTLDLAMVLVGQCFEKLMSTESVIPSNHLILFVPLLLPSVFPSTRIFSNKLALHIRCQSTGNSALASVLPMNISRLISFRIDWFDLLAFQGALKSLLQHHSSKASVLQCSAFFKF